MTLSKYIRGLLVLGTLGIIIAEILYYQQEQNFSPDVIVGILALAVFFYFQKHFKSRLGMTLIVIGLLMNAFGILGAYDLSFLGLGWDKYLHLISSCGIMLELTYHYFPLLRDDSGKGKVFIYATCFLITLWIGAFHEINEFIGSQVFWNTEWILATQNGSWPNTSILDQHDAYFDLVFDAIGITIAIIIDSTRRFRNKKKTQASS